jgi:hypothetical protein
MSIRHNFPFCLSYDFAMRSKTSSFAASRIHVFHSASFQTPKPGRTGKISLMSIRQIFWFCLSYDFAMRPKASSFAAARFHIFHFASFQTPKPGRT